jgi:hypothetical protein
MAQHLFYPMGEDTESLEAVKLTNFDSKFGNGIGFKSS